MSKIRVLNQRTFGGHLFHYAHFISDCLIPEVVGGLYNYETVLRPRTVRDTLGVFSGIYEEVMNCKNVECDVAEFNSLDIEIFYPKIQKLFGVEDISIFREYIFKRFNIVSDSTYPKVLLIKRGDRVGLVKDELLEKQLDGWARTTGKERREINQIDNLEVQLRHRVGDNNFKVLLLENMPFEDQVKYFKNAKYIIGAHGAGLTNMVFCDPGSKIFEVTCGAVYRLFDQFSADLNLDYIKIGNNSPGGVLNKFDSAYEKED